MPNEHLGIEMEWYRLCEEIEWRDGAKKQVEWIQLERDMLCKEPLSAAPRRSNCHKRNGSNLNTYIYMHVETTGKHIRAQARHVFCGYIYIYISVSCQTKRSRFFWNCKMGKFSALTMSTLLAHMVLPLNRTKFQNNNPIVGSPIPILLKLSRFREMFTQEDVCGAGASGEIAEAGSFVFDQRWLMTDSKKKTHNSFW